jgi:glycosyltransferase involved in cell wall biosynthesis
LKKKIAICYPHFLPAYKAGGPIQSIANLIRNLHKEYDFFVITTNKDLASNEALTVIPNAWQDFENGKAKVLYLSNEKAKPFYIKKTIRDLNPDKIIVNGIYSIPFSIVPTYFFPNKTIMHVRGMLHPGALSQKKQKKQMFLKAIKWLGIPSKIVFFASDVQEANYVKAVFGNNAKVKIAQNFPAHFEALPAVKKEVGYISLVSIALISPMKNHALVLKALSLVKATVKWHIYGPIKDSNYWENCLQLIKKLPKNISVSYEGEVIPTEVYITLKKHHFFILPSESENFGHALFEAMIAGKPIITSENTPWNNLETHNAGYNVALTPKAIAQAIEEIAALDDTNYTEKVRNIRSYAELVIDREAIKQQHTILFTI